MTDREAAAGLVERLESLADLDSRSGAPLATAMHEAAAFIRAQAAELERVGKERDRARACQEEGLDRALKAKALVAEAVRVVTELADAADHMGDVANLCMGDDAIAAARAFIERAKES